MRRCNCLIDVGRRARSPRRKPRHPLKRIVQVNGAIALGVPIRLLLLIAGRGRFAGAGSARAADEDGECADLSRGADSLYFLSRSRPPRNRNIMGCEIGPVTD